MTGWRFHQLLIPTARIQLFFLAISLVGLIGLIQPAVSPAAPVFQEAPQTNDALKQAREKAKLTEKRFKTLEKLSPTGSVSQKQVRVAKLQSDLALLELSSQLEPSRRQKNSTIASKLVLKFRSENLSDVRRLFKRGSVSEAVYRRAVVARDVALDDVEALTAATDTQRKLKAIDAARARHELAQEEFSIVEKLFKSGSVSQSRYEQFADQLKMTSAKLQTAKKSLGAKATVVEQ